MENLAGSGKNEPESGLKHIYARKHKLDDKDETFSREYLGLPQPILFQALGLKGGVTWDDS